MKGGELMNYINLNYANYDIKVDDIELPKEIILSLELRGKRSNNHRYDVLNKEIQVRCSRCNKWISIFKYENGNWTDISKDRYWVSTKENTNQNYFADKCYSCYSESKKKKVKIEKANFDSSNGYQKSGQAKEEYCAWSVNNHGIQQTVALTKDNDRYLKLLCVYKNIKKNAMINKIIEMYRSDNPI